MYEPPKDLTAADCAMDEVTFRVARAIAEKSWQIRVEDEQSKTEFEISAPEWSDMSPQAQRGWIREARPLARAAMTAINE